jgi:hypothetical protein
MAKCSRCGKEMGGAASCPECGYGPSQSVAGRSVSKAANVTGDVIEKGVHVAEKVVHEGKPVIKGALNLGKRGVSKAKKETLKVAKSLKEEGD